ncbi:MAG TPA: hypothetical protein VJY62_20650, partial [Bacteroidia bacterium]|nr:hypothetical protein [Bacteroidia bacterium]
VLPLTKNKKYGIEYLFPPFFTQQLGLFSKNKISENKLNDFLISIPEKFRFIEINLNTGNNFTVNSFVQKKNLTHHLNLNSSYQHIFKNYSENLKRNLKKTTKYSQEVIKDADPKKIIKLFRENKGKNLSTLKEKNYQALLKIIETAKQKDILKIYGVTTLNLKPHVSRIYRETLNLIAGAFFIESNGKTIFIFSGADQEAKTKSSMPLLIDTFIKDHSEKNLILDFEGSNDINLARFYKSFGAEEIVYLQIKKNRLPFPLKWIKK